MSSCVIGPNVAPSLNLICGMCPLYLYKQIWSGCYSHMGLV